MQNLLPVFFNQQEKTLTAGEKEILLTRVKNFVWSASSLQTYLNCPRQFLYQYLYRFPRRPLPQMALGVSLHQALERFFKTSLQQENVPVSVLLNEYQRALTGQNIVKEKYDDFLEHGQKILQKYYNEKLISFSSLYPHGYLLEHNFGIVEHDDLRITGTMDKVVFLDEGRTQADIVDYKSGRPRPIKPGEAYWRQLVFYDLLAQNSLKTNWRTSKCVIEFLTPDAQDKLGQRSIEVSEADRQLVLAEIKLATKKIQNLDFPMIPNPTNDPDIDYWQNFGS